MNSESLTETLPRPSASSARQAPNGVTTDASSTRAAAASAMAAALLAACGGGGSGTGTGATAVSSSGSSSSTDGLGSAVAGYSYAKPSSDAEAARFLLQAQFNASDADVAALRTQGYAPWVSAQLNAPAAQTGVQWLDSRGYDTPDAAKLLPLA